MLNKRPIFIHAFARGGSNIIMNMLLSAPSVCLSSGETHKVFKGTNWDPVWRRVKKRIVYDFPIRIMTGEDFFSPTNWNPRGKVPDSTKKYIDKILYHGRFTTLIPTHNLYKDEGVAYTKDEVAQCRLLTKGLNGTVFTGTMFYEMYPDATFFGLIRNGLAVCEGFVRRGYDPALVGKMYNSVAEQILKYSDNWPNYSLFFYEDMTSRPLDFLERIYAHANLDPKSLTKIRLQSKGVMQASGKRVHLKGMDRQVFWHRPSDLSSFIRSDINENQIKQLDPKDKKKFLSFAGEAMEKLGYPVN